jgi:Putative transposase/Transposase zinc-binding domain
MTERHRLEVADVFRQYGEAYLEQYGASGQQRRVVRDIQVCRTAALGGHITQCDQCGHQTIVYNSCRNRHCPKCQGAARARWLDARASELLPVPYFHVVFTVPEVLGPLALPNQRVMYNVLFQAVADTLLEVAANPQRLGARLGVLAVLHTWGQNLLHHPHVHCVVPGGGPAVDGSAWVACREGFFLPVRVLSRVYRGKFIAVLKRAHEREQLRFPGHLRPLAERVVLEQLIDQAVQKEWVVYAKPPCGGPAQVLKYLARYTHRVAISNGRLLSLEDGKVTFQWKDYAHGNRQSTMTLQAAEFIRRFLLHVLPSGFVRIRYYGFLANRFRAANLARCRELLRHRPRVEEPTPQPRETADVPRPEKAGARCPLCHQGSMHVVEVLPRQRPRVQNPVPCHDPPGEVPCHDSS